MLKAMEGLENRLENDFSNTERKPDEITRYEEISNKVIKIAMVYFNDDLFLKAMEMARAIRNFGDELEKSEG